MSEAIAEFAERDFYISLYPEGGRLAERAPKSTRIQQFLSWSDEQLMHNIERVTSRPRKGMNLAQRVKLKNVANISEDEIVKFDLRRNRG